MSYKTIIKFICFVILVHVSMECDGDCTDQPLITKPRQANVASKTLQALIRNPSCPSALYTYNAQFDKCYYVTGTTSYWLPGHTTCTNFGGRMVMPKTDAERIFVSQMIPAGNSQAYVINL